MVSKKCTRCKKAHRSKFKMCLKCRKFFRAFRKLRARKLVRKVRRRRVLNFFKKNASGY